MKAAYSDEWCRLYTADAKRVGESVPERSVHMCVTSPPYFGLRSYLGAEHPDKGDEIGTEATPAEYIEKLVAIFREVHRALRDDGTLWVNISDTYASSPAGNTTFNHGAIFDGRDMSGHQGGRKRSTVVPGVKPKDLLGIPWMLAFALRADGWYLRSEITWEKPNPMPESIKDRPTSSTEKVFLFSKSPKYFYDQEAVRENASPESEARYRHKYGGNKNGAGREHFGHSEGDKSHLNGRNMRNLWRITTRSYKGAHFAVFPPELPERCIKAGTSERGVCGSCGAPRERVVERTAMEVRPSERLAERRAQDQTNDARTATSGTMTKPPTSRTVGWEPTCKCEADAVPATVLDPFAGSGTTLYVARKLGRRSVGFDLDERSAVLLEDRLGPQGVLL